MSRDPVEDYQRAGADLDDHVATCPRCQSGTGCPDGDSAADTEYRAWRQLRDTDPTTARHHQIGGHR